MNKETRIQKIAAIVERDKSNPYGKVDVPWEDQLKPHEVYKIPLEYLVYNKYNGRILSRTKSLEQQNREIDVETDEGKKLVESLLMESNLGRNRETLKSIERLGQEKVGIVTKDGIIIDGNRRAMLLNHSGKFDYFKTVVLDVTLDENPLEIEKLETIYQMGEDEKLGYNATEKYLKAKGLNGRGVSVDKIGEWMGESKAEVEEYLAVMKTMDEYLEYLGYNGIYTQLDGREDLFINLTKWMGSFYKEGSAKGFDGYKSSDVDDLKLISFDYIRAKFEGKEFRIIADGLKEKHFFGDKTIWKSFRDFHFKHMEAIKDSESSIDVNTENIKAHLDDRDRRFYESTRGEGERSFLEENVDIHKQQLRYKQSANKPMQLVNDAIGALDAIDRKHTSSSAPEVLDRIESIGQKALEFLKNKSPERVFAQVIRTLESVKLPERSEAKEEMLASVKEISRMAYQLEKDIKKL